MNDDDVFKKLEEMHRDQQDGNKSLHNRHDQHDQQIGWLHEKVDRLRRLVAALWHGDMAQFLREWHS